MSAKAVLQAVSTAEVSSFLGGMSKMLGSVGALSGGIATLGASFVVLGTIQMASAAGAAREFQAEMTRLETLVGLSAEQVERLSRAVIRLSPELGSPPTELASALFAITSGGERSAAALEVLEQAAKASRIGMGDMTSIARVATAAMQAYAGSNLSAEQAIDTMVATVREGNLVAEELSTAFGRVIGIASTMGVSFQEVGAFIATFTRLGVNAEIAATSLRAALTAILSPGVQARETFRQIGTSVEEVRQNIQENGLTDAFIELLRISEGNQDVIGKLLPNVRALSGVLGTAGVQSKQYMEITDSVNNSLGVTNEAFETVEGTLKDAMQDIGAVMESFKVDIGQNFLDPLTAMLNLLEAGLIPGLETFADYLNFVGSVLTLNGEAAKEHIKDFFGLGQAFEGAADSSQAIIDRLQSMTNLELQEWTEEIRANMRTIGQIMQGDAFASASAERQTNLRRLYDGYRRSLARVREEEERRARALEGQLGNGIRVVVGMTEDQIEAAKRMLVKMREEQLEMRGLNRQILEEKLTREGITGTYRAQILARYDQIQAMKEEQAEQERIDKFWAEHLQFRQDYAQKVRRQGSQERERRLAEERRFQEMMSAIILESDLDRLREHNRRMTEIATSMSDAMADAAIDIATATESISAAFEQMITEILVQIARLKLQKAILDPLMALMVPIPGAPDAIPTPQIDVSGYGLGSVGLGGSAPTAKGAVTVVRQNINFQPNFVDGESGQRWLKQQKGTIAGIVGEAAMESTTLARQLRGAR